MPPKPLWRYYSSVTPPAEQPTSGTIIGYGPPAEAEVPWEGEGGGG
jgi:hypothetical protein